MKNFLKDIRQRRNLTLKELSSKSGKYAWQTISAYENSDRRLTEEFLKNISDALGCSIEEIQPQDAEEVENRLQESSHPYGQNMIAVDILPTARLEEMIKDLTNQIGTAEGEERRKIMHAMVQLTRELIRRDAREDHASSKPLSEAQEIAKRASASAETDPSE